MAPGPADFIAAYIGAEKSESLLFMAIGAACVLVALWALGTRKAWRGAAGPLIAIAAIQLVVGSTVYLRSDAQQAALQAQHQTDRAGFVRDETKRMNVVVANFQLYKGIEIALLIVGAAVAARYRRHSGWRPFGLALALQSGLMLGADLFAEARADVYLAAVRAAG